MNDRGQKTEMTIPRQMCIQLPINVVILVYLQFQTIFSFFERVKNETLLFDYYKNKGFIKSIS